MRQRRRHDRNALLWAGACFAVLQLGLTAAIAWRMPQLRDPEFVLKAQRLCARASPGQGRPFTVVMLGSSRTYYAFDAGQVEVDLAAALGRPAVVFNFGITGAGPLSHLLNLNRLLAEGVRPDLLLVEVLPPALAEQAQTKAADRLPANRLWHRDLAVVAPYASHPERLCAAWWEACALPWYRHRFTLLSQVLPFLLPGDRRLELHPVDASGWTGGSLLTSVTPAQYRRGVAQAYREYGRLLEEFCLDPGPARPLDDLLALCRREGIAAALVLLPEGSEFRGWYPSATWAQVEDYLGELGRRFGAPLIDARTWVADEHFYDAHHLFRGGATVFTERFGREAVLPLARAAGGLAAADYAKVR